MMTAPEAATVWLDRQRPSPPPRLRARMFEALAATPDAGPDGEAPALARRLAEAAIGILEGLVGGEEAGDPGRTARDRALDLLAADALLTGACQAAGEVGPDAVLAIAEQYGPRRLAQLLPNDLPESGNREADGSGRAAGDDVHQGQPDG